MSATDPVILSAVRTPIGKRGGRLAKLHPAELLGSVLLDCVQRVGVDPADVEQVLAGCVTQAGDQAYNVARTALLTAGFPVHVPGTSIDAQCGSSQQALHLAAALVESAAADVILVGGIESMSRVPLGSAVENGPGHPLSPVYRERYEVIHQGESAERIADTWGITRQDCDAWALRSQSQAALARDRGYFEREIMPVEAPGGTVLYDEGIRESTLDKLAALSPAFRDDGRHTAGNSSQISDGAAAVLIASRRWAQERRLRIRARIEDHLMVGVDPVLKLTGPIPATRAILGRQKMGIGDVDLFEVNEAFASVVLAWLHELHAPQDRVNVNGGAIALGHPVGATGARLVTTALHELERREDELALITMCCGGGLGTAALIVAE